MRGYSALQTGLALLPEGLLVAFASALSGRLTGRLGPRRPMLIGLLTGTAGFAALAAARRATGYALLVAPLVTAVGVRRRGPAQEPATGGVARARDGRPAIISDG